MPGDDNMNAVRNEPARAASAIGSGDAAARFAALQAQFKTSYGEIFDDPQYKARGNIAFVSDERAGKHALPNVVPRLTETPGGIDTLGPALGAHNDEVFKGLLGLSDETMQRLRAENVI